MKGLMMAYPLTLTHFFERSRRLFLRKSLATLKGEAGARVKVEPDHCFVGLDAYQKVIDSGVEVVVLATPPGFRPQHLQAAVAAGKHVFCEKPMATDAPGVRTVLAAVEEAKKKKLATGGGGGGRSRTTHGFVGVWIHG